MTRNDSRQHTSCAHAALLEQIEDNREAAYHLVGAMRDGRGDLLPLSWIAYAVAREAIAAEWNPKRRDLAQYEAARNFIRCVKRAILDGALVARLPTGAAMHTDAWPWLREDETLKPLDQMMPDPRIMVRRGEIRAWLEASGSPVPDLLADAPAADAGSGDAGRQAANDNTRKTEGKAPTAIYDEIISFVIPQLRQQGCNVTPGTVMNELLNRVGIGCVIEANRETHMKYSSVRWKDLMGGTHELKMPALSKAMSRRGLIETRLNKPPE